jgi:ATP-dependent DNA helicase RecQ
LNREERVKRLVDFRYGETMFLFVSPERFVMEDFRNIIQNIEASLFGLAFAFCVIDEVHCVSEWGHDFRTTYLMLGKNAQRFSKTRSGNPVTLVGLTATASFDVLADIERELQIQHDDVSNAIIMIENTIRPELFFRVIDVEKTQRMRKLNEDFSNMGNNLQRLNNLELLEKSIQDHKNNFEDTEIVAEKYLIKNKNGKTIQLSEYTQNDFYSIIFCPIKGQRGNPHGVDMVYQNLDSNSKGYFYSSDTDDLGQDIQRHFEDFTHDRTKHIVCTKAFGMGIDKKDIRSTYHFVYSGSLESLVQEAGRAGRDKKIAEANILASISKNVRLSHECLLKNNPNDSEINVIPDIHQRKKIRNRIIGVAFQTKEDLEDTINSVINGFQINNLLEKERLKERLNSFIIATYSDRSIHDFFYDMSFKGIDVEKNHFDSLFNDNEFYYESRLDQLQKQYNNLYNTKYTFNYWNNNNRKRIYVEDRNTGNKIGHIDVSNNNSVFPNNTILSSILDYLMREIGNNNFDRIAEKNIKIDIINQNTFKETFQSANKDNFDFTITAEKKYFNTKNEIGKLLNIPEDYRWQIENALENAFNFEDFILRLEEIGLNKITIINSHRNQLQSLYQRNREKNDTGRLIYRMHSMGLLTDYIIDYNKNNLYYCTFVKYNTIKKYIDIIEEYLRRYLSENTALQNIEELKRRLTKDTLIDNIIDRKSTRLNSSHS